MKSAAAKLRRSGHLLSWNGAFDEDLSHNFVRMIVQSKSPAPENVLATPIPVDVYSVKQMLISVTPTRTKDSKAGFEEHLCPFRSVKMLRVDECIDSER